MENIIQEVWKEISIINPDRKIALILTSVPAVWAEGEVDKGAAFYFTLPGGETD